MANCCFNSLCFYSDEHPENLLALRNDLLSFYSERETNWIGTLFIIAGIPIEGIGLRGDINYLDIQNTHIKIDLESAWSPLYDAYDALDSYYGLSHVLLAEEPGDSLFINTDTYGTFFDSRYIVIIYKGENIPAQEEYQKLFADNDDSEFSFSSEGDLLKWFQNYGFKETSVEELKFNLNCDFVRVEEFVNPNKSDKCMLRKKSNNCISC